MSDPLTTQAANQHPVRQGVLEPQVELAPPDRRLAAQRIAADVERVRVVLDVFESGEERGVVDGCRDLRDSAAVLLDERRPFADHDPLDESVVLASFANACCSG